MNDKELYYFNRTLEHIHRVHKNALYLVTNHAQELGLSVDHCREFMEQVLSHDISKFSSKQFRPYVDFSWAKKEDEELTEDEQEAFDQAWYDHYNSENHHPEKVRGVFSSLEILEVVCDLQSMADEFGEGSCREFFEDNWVPKHKEKFGRYWPLMAPYFEDAISCFDRKVKNYE